MQERSLSEIAKLIGGTPFGDSGVKIRAACGIKDAREGDLTFVSGQKYLPLLKTTRASAVIVGKDVDWREKPVIVAENPALSFLKALEIWRPAKPPFEKGIHPRAIIAASAKLAADVTVGAGAVIEDDCVIGEGSAVLAQSFIGRGTRIGRNAVIYQNVTVRENARIDDRVILHCGVTIGSDGFGYETIERRHVKVPQVGTVWIQDDVEIGANSCVDRARFGITTVKKGTKIDNLVQIAHNVVIGENCLIVSQAGVAGSAEIGDNVILAGQVGVVGHVTVGENSMIGAQSGVFTSVPPNSVLLGSPPRPVREEKELMVYVSKLPELFKQVRELRKKIEGSSVPDGSR